MNRNLASIELANILHTTEIINFLTEIVRHFAKNLNADQWDFVRIAISSWVLTVSKSSDHFRKPKVTFVHAVMISARQYTPFNSFQIAIFTAAVYKLFTVLYEFINSENEKSSTNLLKDVIEEWEQIFAKDVNLILLKCFMRYQQQPNGKQIFFKTNW